MAVAQPEPAKLRFAIDHNSPAPVLATFSEIITRVELVPIFHVAKDMATLSDWEVFRRLHQDGWDGLVTNDHRLLALPREMSVLAQTRLTLVVTSGEGHNPIRAVGLLLCHLNHIAHQNLKTEAQVWHLKVNKRS